MAAYERRNQKLAKLRPLIYRAHGGFEPQAPEQSRKTTHRDHHQRQVREGSDVPVHPCQQPGYVNSASRTDRTPLLRNGEDSEIMRCGDVEEFKDITLLQQ